MSAILSVFLLASLRLTAADVTGRWNGKIEYGIHGQQKDGGDFFVDLKQSGEQITGTAGPAKFPITNGSIDGPKVRFAVQIGPTKLIFVLRMVGQSHLIGQGETDPASEVSATLDLRRNQPLVDVTGTWTGGWVMPGDATYSATLILKQNGSGITGTTGTGAIIQNGSIDGATVTFDMAAGNAVLSVNLRVNGDRMDGDITAKGTPYRAALSLKKKIE
jgi:hypothetical protein